MTTPLDALDAFAQRVAALTISATQEEASDEFKVLVQHASKAAQAMEADNLDAPAVEFTGDETDPQIPVSDYLLTEEDVVAANDIWSIAHYLGDDYEKRILDLHSAEPVPIDCLTITLFPHQERGVAKVMHLFRSPSFGGILGDEMGLGKTLTSLTAMWLDGKTRRGCFSLILTTKSCTKQWTDEICDYFKPACRPRYFVLNDPNITAQELLEKNVDFVITTPQFVQSQHHRLEEYKAFKKEIDRVGIEVARRDKRFAKMKLFPPPKASLYSSIYKDLLLPFKHVAFDEAQWGKDVESKTHLAVKALYRVCTLLISGTFVANRWTDVFTFIDLIPGHPFKDMVDFQRAFSKDRARPPNTQFDNLNRFLLGFVVARPNSVLRLKGATIQHAEFELDDATEGGVTLWMMKWYRAMQIFLQQRHNSKEPVEHQSTNEDRIMRLVQAAQMLASHPLMSDSAKSDEDTSTVAQLLGAFQELLKGQMLVENTPRHNIGASDDAVNAPDFREHTIQAAEYLNNEGKTTNVLEKEVFRKCNLPVKESSTGGKPTTRQPPKRMREIWLKKLRNMESGDLFSARVEKIKDLILDCKMKHPGEKIVVFSHYLRFLDLLGEALHRQDKSHEICVFQFNGQMSVIEREVEKIKFRDARSTGLNVILVTAGCGGAGVNLASASVVIQSEVWWNRNEEMQAWFRVRRPSQVHEVSIYLVVATNSVVDYHIIATRDQKSQVVSDMMAILRHEDGEGPEIPDVVPY